MVDLSIPRPGTAPVHAQQGDSVERFVDTHTSRQLRVGQTVIDTVKQSLLPNGAGNIDDDLTSTRGGTADLVDRTRTTPYVSGRHTDVPWDAAYNNMNDIARAAAVAVTTGGGNCQEHADVVFTKLRELLPPGTPIHQAEYLGFDHAFVIIGEIADEETDVAKTKRKNCDHNDNLVVVDAWPSHPQVCLVKDHQFRTQAGNRTLSSTFRGVADGKDALSKRVDKLGQVYSDQTDQYLNATADKDSARDFDGERATLQSPAFRKTVHDVRDRIQVPPPELSQQDLTALLAVDGIFDQPFATHDNEVYTFTNYQDDGVRTRERKRRRIGGDQDDK